MSGPAHGRTVFDGLQFRVRDELAGTFTGFKDHLTNEPASPRKVCRHKPSPGQPRFAYPRMPGCPFRCMKWRGFRKEIDRRIHAFCIARSITAGTAPSAADADASEECMRKQRRVQVCQKPPILFRTTPG